jgi:hypothetical protein
MTPPPPEAQNVTIVTGASQGIGEGIAAAFLTTRFFGRARLLAAFSARRGPDASARRPARPAHGGGRCAGCVWDVRGDGALRPARDLGRRASSGATRRVWSAAPRGRPRPCLGRAHRDAAAHRARRAATGPRPLAPRRHPATRCRESSPSAWMPPRGRPMLLRRAPTSRAVRASSTARSDQREDR